MSIHFMPHDYQTYCINRIVESESVGLFLDMGLGKTVITLTAIKTLKMLGLVNRVLVIAPKLVAERTWIKEKYKWDHLTDIDMGLCVGSRAKRVQALQNEHFVTVMGRDTLPWLVELYGEENWQFDMVVIDELTSIKNQGTKRFKCLKQVLPKIHRRVGLTGTPAPKGLHDLWAQVYFLDEGERLGAYVSWYRNRFFYQNPWDKFNYHPKDTAFNDVMNSISDICISMSADDYLDMPELMKNTISISLSTKDRKTYDTLEQEFVAEVDGEEVTALNAASLGNKLLQLCNGAIYEEESEGVDRPYKVLHDAKLDALGELLEASQGQPIMVMYSFVHDAKRIEERFSKKYRVMRITDPKAEELWNAGSLDILLAHPASAAFGLNLQECGYISVWFGLTWNLELYQQSIARLYRQGQQSKTVIVHHMIVENSMDEVVYESLADKDTTQERIIEAVKARVGEVMYG